jgi:hypothetical protein
MKNLLESIRGMYAPQAEATMMQDDGKVVHNCAKHVEHAEWGQGNCISEEHAAPDRNGNIAWYDIMFEHGLERGVPTAELKILQAESHMHSMKKTKKVAEDLNINAPVSTDPKQAIKKKAMDDALAAANRQGPTGAIDKIVHQGVTKEEKETQEKLEDDEVQAAGHKKTKEKYETMSKMPERMKEHIEFSMTVEEFDQLDELSKQTLGSYVKKAKEHAVGLGVGLGVAAMKRRDRSDVADKLKQRTKNIDKAVDRITNEEVEELDEAKEKKPEYDKDKVVAGVQAAMLKSRGNVIAGRAERAAARLAAKVKQRMKEEVEELDEKEGRGSSDPLENRADYAKKHGTGQVYKKTHAGDKTGMTQAYAYAIRRTGPKGKLPEEVDFPIQEDHDQYAPSPVDETIIAATKEYDISEAQKSSGYDAHFKAMMTKHGIKHPGELDTPEKKKAFFNKVDASYKAKNEDVFLEAYMASDLMAVKDAHKKAGNKISNETTGSKNGEAHHSFVVTTPAGKRTRHIYHGKTKKVETMSAAPRSKEAKETGDDEDDK